MRLLSPSIVSSYPDSDGNYRAINDRAAGFVGYGKTPQEADENLRRNVTKGERASSLAIVEATFMTLPPADQARFIEDQPKLRRA